MVTALAPFSKSQNSMGMDRNAAPREELNDHHQEVATLFKQTALYKHSQKTYSQSHRFFSKNLEKNFRKNYQKLLLQNKML